MSSQISHVDLLLESIKMYQSEHHALLPSKILMSPSYFVELEYQWNKRTRLNLNGKFLSIPIEISPGLDFNFIFRDGGE